MKVVLAALFVCGGMFCGVVLLSFLIPHLPTIAVPFVAIGGALLFIMLCIVAVISFNSPNGWTGIRDLITREPKRQIDDPVFGSMEASGQSTGGRYYWTGKTRFAPVGEEIFVGINADESGPVQSQRQFYKRIETEYRSHIASITTALEAEAAGVAEGCEYPPSENGNHFRLEIISISAAEKRPVSWNLTFCWSVDTEWGFEVDMKDWNIDAITVSH